MARRLAALLLPLLAAAAVQAAAVRVGREVRLPQAVLHCVMAHLWSDSSANCLGKPQPPHSHHPCSLPPPTPQGSPACRTYTSKGLIQPATGSLQDVIVVQASQ